MKFWFALLAFGVLVQARAQLSVEIVLDQEQFLKDESMPIKVRITNRSGQTLKLGAEKDWLTFSVGSRDGFTVGQLREVPVLGEFSLESATVVTRKFDLMSYFNFGDTGRYTIGATVRVADWNKEMSSKPARVEVVRGTKMWEQEFGVPTEKGLPEVRKYILQQARFLKDLVLYVRVTNFDESHSFRVFPAGQLVSFSRPEAQVDKESKLHLLFQTGARSFIYSMIRPDGEVLSRQTYDYSGGSRPVLKIQENGNIAVYGGARRITAEETARLIAANTNEVRAVKP
jgi:hypothetical protein